MKKAIYQGIKQLQVVEAPIPSIGRDEILLKVKYCTICGTDLRIYNFGHRKVQPEDQRVLGHEFVGEIVAVGEGVTGWQPGTKVVVAPNYGCGQCHLCVQGWRQLCKDTQAFGITLDGGFQEYMRITSPAIQQGNIFEIPAGVSYEEAVLTEPLSCAYNCYETVNTRAGDIAVVIGAGPIGLMHVQLAKLCGAKEVILSEPVEERLLSGKDFGADVLVNPLKEDLGKIVEDRTAGRGADVVITACSIPEVQQQALEIAAVGGRVNFFGGLPKGKDVVPLVTNLIHYKQLVVTGNTGSNNEQFRRSLELIAAKRVDVKNLLGPIYPLENIKEAFEASGLGKRIAVGFEG